MDIKIQPMTEKDAIVISKWHYADPYSCYDMGEEEEVIAELLDGSYYVAQSMATCELVGFFCFGASAQVPGGHKNNAYNENALDIGLGLRPDLTSKGIGLSFLNAGLGFS